MDQAQLFPAPNGQQVSLQHTPMHPSRGTPLKTAVSFLVTSDDLTPSL